MAPQEHTITLHAAAPAKPDWGQPCNGCGLCCAAETCPLGRALFLRRSPCPALTWQPDQARYGCGLMMQPAHYLPLWPSAWHGLARRLIRRWLAVGAGCDSDATVV